MIHYHGLPITPNSAALSAVTGGHAFVSYRHAGQLAIAAEVCQSFAVDNGAFSAWKSGEPVKDWRPFCEWADEVSRLPNCDFFVFPDVIDGNEQANDELMFDCVRWCANHRQGAPVWHMHESMARLETLATQWPRVCIGSSGEFATVGNERWWGRIAEAMNAVCDEHGRPKTKLHGLRMLDPEIFTRLPFASADSTNIGQNVGIDSAWRGTYTPVSKDARARVMRERIEAHQSAQTWQRQLIQGCLLCE